MTAAPLTDAYLTKTEKEARRLPAMLSSHVLRLIGEIRRLKSLPPPAPPTPAAPQLVEAINRQTAALLAGGLPAVDRSIYTAQDPYTPKFTRSPSCWLNGAANLTCFSPAQLSGTPWNQRAGTLITRRHIVYANHFGIPVIEGGTPILFVDRGGSVVERKVVAQVADQASDIAIGLLDSEVPRSIEVAPVLPEDFERHLPKPFLAVALDGEEKASVLVCDTFHAGNFSTNQLNANWMPPEWKSLAAWGEATVTGDSGNPVFALIYGELVLLGCWWTAMGGPHLGARQDQVNKMLEQLSPGGGYRLKVKNL